MIKKSFVLYLDLLGSLEQLTDAQAGKLFKAIKAYHMSVSEEASQECKAEFDSLMDDFVTRLAFHPFRTAFERDAEKYQGLVDRNRKNGKKGGRKKDSHKERTENPENPVGSLGSLENPIEPNQTQSNPKGDDNGNGNVNVNVNNLAPSNKGACPANSPDPPVPLKQIVDFWNKAMNGKGIPGVSRITAGSKRVKSVKARFKEYGLEKIYQAIINASESRFMNGYNSRNWVATFDWVFLPSNFPKVLEGNFKNQEPHENNQTDKFSERRGTEPGAESRKGFKGTF
ncbi:MAG: hypothetical protein HDR79_07655 [Bacteroides sp.]|nr:hypothetical protein [Bacteroides sp.]